MQKKPKERLIEAAQFLLCHEGLGNLKVRRLVKKAFTSPDRLYAYYSSIDNLVIEVHAKGWEVIVKTCGVTMMRATNNKQRIYDIVESIFSSYLANPQLIGALIAIEATGRSENFWPTLEANTHRQLVYAGLRGGVAGTHNDVATELFIGGIEQVLFKTLPLNDAVSHKDIAARGKIVLKMIEAYMTDQEACD